MSEFGNDMAPPADLGTVVEAPSEPVDLGAGADYPAFEEQGDTVVNGSPGSPEFEPNSLEFTEPAYPIPDGSSVVSGGADLGAAGDASVDDATASDPTAHDLGALALSDTVHTPEASDTGEEQAAHDLGAAAAGAIADAPSVAGAQANAESPDDLGNPMLEPDDEVLPESLPDLTENAEPNESGPPPELDVAVDGLDGGGEGKTDVGWEFLPDDDKPFAQDVPEYPGEYVLDLHGAPDSVQVGEHTSMDAAEFAETVKSQTDWDGTTPIRLFSCSTGADQAGFAQQLSDELGVEVTAPTAPVWSVKNGEPLVTEADPDTGEPIDPPTGSWISFKPSGK